MQKTANGYTVISKAPSPALTAVNVGAVRFVVWTPSARLWTYALKFLNAVEPFRQEGWDGGWAPRKIAGTDVWSEHAAGAACDVNAAQHPRGGARFAGWTPDQVRVIRWWLSTDTGRMFTWGADWTNPDPMHFQLKPRSVWDSTDGWWKH